MFARCLKYLNVIVVTTQKYCCSRIELKDTVLNGGGLHDVVKVLYDLINISIF